MSTKSRREGKSTAREQQDVRYWPTLEAFEALDRPVPDLPRYRQERQEAAKR